MTWNLLLLMLREASDAAADDVYLTAPGRHGNDAVWESDVVEIVAYAHPRGRDGWRTTVATCTREGYIVPRITADFDNRESALMLANTTTRKVY